MPEGDTVWLTAHRLDAALAGRTLTVADLRVPALATTDLTGADVTEVVARGKHILTRLDTGHTLHSHLRMDGSWHLTRAGAAPRRHPEHMIRALLGNADWLATGYRVHDLTLVPTGREAELVGHLGPDLLGPDWDADLALANLRRTPELSVGEALLDQRNLAGIGNMYKCEALFARRVNPWTPVADVRPAGRGDRDGASVPAREPRPSGPVDDRADRPWPGALGVRPARRTVPAVPHADRLRRAGRTAVSACDVLVPDLPAGPGQAEAATSP